MGAEKGSASKAGMSKKSASSPKTQGIIQGMKADQYAKEKLGITATVANPNQPMSTANLSGYYSTKGNQMYGSEYQKARNEYLASQGLGTMQKNGSFTTGVQTDKGLVFTSTAREAYEATKREPIPLSRQMYDSQKLFSSTAFAVMGALAGMPTLGITGANYIYNMPYSAAIKIGNRSSTYYTAPKSSGDSKSTNTGTVTSTTSSTETPYKESIDAARLARLKKEGAGQARKFYKLYGKSITGKMSTK